MFLLLLQFFTCFSSINLNFMLIKGSLFIYYCPSFPLAMWHICMFFKLLIFVIRFFKLTVFEVDHTGIPCEADSHGEAALTTSSCSSLSGQFIGCCSTFQLPWKYFSQCYKKFKLPRRYNKVFVYDFMLFPSMFCLILLKYYYNKELVHNCGTSEFIIANLLEVWGDEFPHKTHLLINID